MADAAIDICPMCAYRTVDPANPDGICWTCSGRRQVNAFEAKDRLAAEQRNVQWREWSNTPEAMAARQRRHRLREAVRPTKPAGEWVDPWEVAKKALDDLWRVRPALRSQVTARAHLDDVAEAIRVLAWGPQSAEDSRPAKPAAPIFDLTTPAGRMRRNMHTRWHERGGRPCRCGSRPST